MTLIKASRILSVAAMWFFVFAALVGLGVFLAGMVISQDFLTFNLSELTIHQYFDLQLEAYLSDDILNSDITLKSILITGGLRAIAGSAFLVGLFYLLKRIMTSVENARPFASEVTSSLKWIALGFIIAGIVIPIFDYVFMRSIITQIDGGLLEANYNLGVGYFLIGALLYILMRIFEYGRYLQTEFDETV